MKSKKRSQAARHQRTTTDRSRSGTPLLQRIEPDAAGIDCGAEYHYVAVPPIGMLGRYVRFRPSPPISSGWRTGWCSAE